MSKLLITEKSLRNRVLAFCVGLLMALGILLNPAMGSFFNAKAESTTLAWWSIVDTQDYFTTWSVSDNAAFSEEKVSSDGEFTFTSGLALRADSSVRTLADAPSPLPSSVKHFIDFKSVGSRSTFNVKFETTGPALATFYGGNQGNDGNRYYVFESSVMGADEEYTKVAVEAGSSGNGKKYTAILPFASTWYLYSLVGPMRLYGIAVQDDLTVEYEDFNNLSEPSITGISKDNSTNTVNVNVSAEVGSKIQGDKLVCLADSVSISMYEKEEFDAKGDDAVPINTVITTESSVRFAPEKSGDYTFTVKLIRETEENGFEEKVGEPVDFTFSYTLYAPNFRAKMITVDEAPAIQVILPLVHEAEQYIIETNINDAGYETLDTITVVDGVAGGDYYDEKDNVFKIRILGLELTDTVKVRVTVKRGEESKETEQTFTVRSIKEDFAPWASATFGPSAKGRVTNSLNDADTVNIKSDEKGSGKLQMSGSDGMTYHYTKIAKDYNFSLTTKIKVNSWTYDNAQEGFVVLARDSAPHSSSVDRFVNSYGFTATKVEYYYDTAAGKVAPEGDKISMRVGLGARRITGIKNPTLMPEVGTTIAEMRTLESYYGSFGANNYNIVAGHGSTAPNSAPEEQRKEYSDFYVTLKKSNTGFEIILINPELTKDDKSLAEIETLMADPNNYVREVLYDWEELFVQDESYVYVGIGAGRGAFDIDATLLELDISDPDTDPPAEDRPIKRIPLTHSISSARYTGTRQYGIMFKSNASGKLTVKDAATNEVLVDNFAIVADIEANVKTIELMTNQTNLTYTFTPNADFNFGDEFTLLESYDPVSGNVAINYRRYGTEGQVIFVAPHDVSGSDAAQYGHSTHMGTAASPLDIYTAFRYVQPGQTIRLAAGEYTMTSSLVIPRGHNGTADKPIRVVGELRGADDALTTGVGNSAKRPILNFGRENDEDGVQGYVGIVHWGNYWHFKGFDVTRTRAREKGFQVSGHYNTVEEVNTYNNGSTGLQISGVSTEPNTMWPTNNLILNCTSFDNKDPGYQDADGYACKLTSGAGNVFDGCIAYNNADDGWDFFAKPETGPIGVVRIQNSVTFGNGYRLNAAEGKSDNLGNGNGFKMGGNSIAGAHVIENSLAFNNAAKGIDSNSGPDIIVINSTSFNNGAANVALYSNAAATAYKVNGVLSYKTSGGQENLNAKGDNNEYAASTNIFSTATVNAAYGFSAVSLGLNADSFVSVDTTAAADALITRYNNGMINVNGLMQLSAAGLTKVASQTAANANRAPGAIFTDASGTAGSALTYAELGSEVTVDTTKPVIVFDMSASAKTGEIEIVFTVSDNFTDSKYIDIDIQVYYNESDEVEVVDGKFNADQAGMYTIEITATDEKGNTTTEYFDIAVTKTGRGGNGGGGLCGSVAAPNGGIDSGLALMFGALAISAFVLVLRAKRKEQF